MTAARQRDRMQVLNLTLRKRLVFTAPEERLIRAALRLSSTLTHAEVTPTVASSFDTAINRHIYALMQEGRRLTALQRALGTDRA